MTESGYEPCILGICCNWCTHGGTDQAEPSRLQRPVNLRMMNAMHGDRVEPQWSKNLFMY